MIEESPSNISNLSPEEQSAVEQFQDSVSRNSEGRYIVALPHRDSAPLLGASRLQAMRRFQQNRTSLMKRGRWEDFQRAVADGELGHAEPVPLQDLSKPPKESYYMPMHGVVKETSTSTKLRVVLDASAQTTTGYSLNSTVLPRPSLYPLLSDILIRFRTHRIGISSDISKMFQEIQLQQPQEKEYHRFLQLLDSGEWQDWRMTRLTFGVASSPFLATQVLRKLADDYSQSHSQAADLIRTSFYVDDCLTGADTVAEADSIRTSLNSFLSKAKMMLRKSRSSSDELLATIPVELRETETKQHIQSPSSHINTHGLHWDTDQDSFHVATPVLGQDASSTKCRILSDVSQTLDVLGWFSPVTITVKALIQQLWLFKIGWDGPVPDDLAQKWQDWWDQLHLVTTVAIPRYNLDKQKTIRSIQVHGFSDSSETVYGGAVYLRTTCTDATITTALVIAKSKVIPLKKLTIPKLELCAVLLTSKQVQTVSSQLSVDSSNVSDGVIQPSRYSGSELLLTI